MCNEYFLASRDIPQRRPVPDAAGSADRPGRRGAPHRDRLHVGRALLALTRPLRAERALPAAVGAAPGARGRCRGYLGESNPWRVWLVLEQQQAPLLEEMDGQRPCRNDR